MKTYALIPARSGSKRVQNKNILYLGGLPLLAYSIYAAKATIEIDEVWVSTDSTIYAEIAQQEGAATIMRSRDMSGDAATDYSVVKHFLDELEITEGLIVYLRPTTPFRTARNLSHALYQFNYALHNFKPQPTSMRSVHEMSESAYKCMKIECAKLTGLGISVEEAGLPNDTYPKTFQANGYVDIIRPELVADNILWGPEVMPWETKRVTEVDTYNDFEMLEWELKAKGGVHVY